MLINCQASHERSILTNCASQILMVEYVRTSIYMKNYLMHSVILITAQKVGMSCILFISLRLLNSLRHKVQLNAQMYSYRCFYSCNVPCSSANYRIKRIATV